MKIEKIESYPSLTIDEQETVLTWDAKERAWHICTDYPAHARKYEAALDESKPVKKGYRDGVAGYDRRIFGRKHIYGPDWKEAPLL